MRVGVKWMLLTLMFATGAAMQTATARAEDTIPVLVYHRFGPVATELTTVRTETLATELAWLHANSIAVLPLHEVVERLKASTAPAPAAVVLTADDGNEFDLHGHVSAHPALSHAGYAVCLSVRDFEFQISFKLGAAHGHAKKRPD